MAKDRVISTVDPEARHGHKSRNRRFDGYKTHLSIDPDSELIDEVAVTAANMPDRDAVDDLVRSLADEEDKPEVVGDSAYADGATRAALGEEGFEVVAKVPPVRNATGLYTKDRFIVDLETQSVTCPAGQRVAINPTRDGGGRASFKIHCKDCPLRRACTKSRAGRTSPSAATKACSRWPEPNRPPPRGRRAIGRTAPRSSARSPISRAADGVGATPACEDADGSPPTSTPGPVPSTWLDWPSSVWIMTVSDGACGAVEALSGRFREREPSLGSDRPIIEGPREMRTTAASYPRPIERCFLCSVEPLVTLTSGAS